MVITAKVTLLYDFLPRNIIPNIPVFYYITRRVCVCVCVCQKRKREFFFENYTVLITLI